MYEQQNIYMFCIIHLADILTSLKKFNFIFSDKYGYIIYLDGGVFIRDKRQIVPGSLTFYQSLVNTLGIDNR